MEKDKTISATEPKARGGKREGAGRKKGSKDQVSIKNLLESLYSKTNGKHYEDLLIADFLDARERKDQQLIMKYHQLILQKVMTSLNRIEVTEGEDVIAAKKLAFADALSKLTQVIKD